MQLDTMKTRKALINTAFLCLFVVAAPALVFVNVYFIREDGGGEVLWNSNEAYLFVGTSRSGYHMRLIEYPWRVIEQSLGAGAGPPDDKSSSGAVFHIISSGIERHVTKVSDAGYAMMLTPLGGQIYGNCSGTLCKWTGASFEIATEEEQRRLNGINKLVATNIPSDKAFSFPLDSDAAGWSARYFSGLTFTVDVDEKFKLQLTNQMPERSIATILSIDLSRSGQPTERIWYLDGRPRMVGRQEYNAAFGIQ